MAIVTEFPNSDKNQNTSRLLPELEIKSENAQVYAIELTDSFDPDAQSPEVLEAIDEANRKFEDTILREQLMRRATPCSCQHPRMIERARTRMEILGANPNNGIPIMQEDIDTRHFGVVITCKDGVYQNIEAIVSRCKGCSDVHIWCELEPVTSLLAHTILDHMNNADRRNAMIEEQFAKRAASNVEGSTNPRFILENTETGEQQVADDLGALFAGGVTSSDKYDISEV